jgi:hypothetical protein
MYLVSLYVLQFFGGWVGDLPTELELSSVMLLMDIVFSQNNANAVVFNVIELL